MEDVVKKCENLLEVVELSLSPKVADLDEAKLERCFQWAAYFEKVHTRISAKPAVVSSFNEKLQKLASCRNVVLGSRPFTVDFLRDCQSVIYQNLLSNGNFPPKLLSVLLTKNGSSQFVKDVTSLIHQRAILHHITHFTQEEDEKEDRNRQLDRDSYFLRVSIEKYCEDPSTITPAHWHKTMDAIASMFAKVCDVTDDVTDATETVLRTLLPRPPAHPHHASTNSPHFDATVRLLDTSACNRAMALVDRHVIRQVAERFSVFFAPYVRSLDARLELYYVTSGVDDERERGDVVGDVEARFRDLLTSSNDVISDSARDHLKANHREHIIRSVDL